MKDWSSHGFAAPPTIEISPEKGLLLYRCWGGRSTEWGTGYFSREKPTSVLDAELRFNIADWGNQILFVSTFRLSRGFRYFAGPIQHGQHDLRRPAIQVYVDGPLPGKLTLESSREVLRQDAFVSPSEGNA